MLKNVRSRVEVLPTPTRDLVFYTIAVLATLATFSVGRGTGSGHLMGGTNPAKKVFSFFNLPSKKLALPFILWQKYFATTQPF